MSFSMALEWREMQTASSKIWTRITDSISHADYYYTKRASFVADASFLSNFKIRHNWPGEWNRKNYFYD